VVVLICSDMVAYHFGVAIVSGATHGGIVHVSSNAASDARRTYHNVFHNYAKTFDHKTYNRLQRGLLGRMQLNSTPRAYAAYAYQPARPHCDRGTDVDIDDSHASFTFPGGAINSIDMFDVGSSAKGPAAAALAAPVALAKQGLASGSGLVQAIIAALIHVVPPLIPPPLWNNQPLACAPMITGHNCFGAVLYPITMADFVIADVTDSMLDGYIAGFPITFAKKVGKTSDSMYKVCFASYMSMMCSSVFPRCTVPQTRDEAIPLGGRVPMCFHLCIVPLIACPGFWIGDIIGQCTMVAVPPMCSQAVYWNVWRLPPQLANYDEANPFSVECPTADVRDGGIDSADSPSLYDKAIPGVSPISREAGVISKSVKAAY